MRALTALLFPPRCVLCRAPLSGETDAMVCAPCSANVRRSYRQTDGVRLAAADDAAAALQYKGSVRAAMVRYKFHHAKNCARWFTAHAAPCLAEKLDEWQPDLLTYVPIGAWRRHVRGYNQCELIARPMAQSMGLPCAQTLRKRLFARRQSAQTPAARLQNAKTAFALRAETNVRGKRVVLLDDVWTTGATLSACTALLRQAGAAKVYVLAVTKTP